MCLMVVSCFGAYQAGQYSGTFTGLSHLTNANGSTLVDSSQLSNATNNLGSAAYTSSSAYDSTGAAVSAMQSATNFANNIGLNGTNNTAAAVENVVTNGTIVAGSLPNYSVGIAGTAMEAAGGGNIITNDMAVYPSIWLDGKPFYFENDTYGTVIIGTTFVTNAWTTGSRKNTFIGFAAGESVSNAQDNTAVGANALTANVSSYGNTAIGEAAMQYTTGQNNTAIGEVAFWRNVTGSFNTAIGLGALDSNIETNLNWVIGIGDNSGRGLQFGTNDIEISDYDPSSGANGPDETNTTRIGNLSTTDAFLAGTIHGNGSGLTNAAGNPFVDKTITNNLLSGAYTAAYTLPSNAVLTNGSSVVTTTGGTNAAFVAAVQAISPALTAASIKAAGGNTNIYVFTTGVRAGTNNGVVTVSNVVGKSFSGAGLYTTLDASTHVIYFDNTGASATSQTLVTMVSNFGPNDAITNASFGVDTGSGITSGTLVVQYYITNGVSASNGCWIPLVGDGSSTLLQTNSGTQGFSLNTVTNWCVAVYSSASQAGAVVSWFNNGN